MNKTMIKTLPRQPLSASQLRHRLFRFNQTVTSLAANRANPVHLSLDNQLLPLFSATFPDPQKVLIPNQPVRQAHSITAYLNHLSRQLNVNGHWHFLSGSLTEQEASGDIFSTLTLTVHHLLQATPHHHFVIPASLLQLKLPSPTAYQSSRLTWYVNTKTSLHLLTTQLLAIGYRRHRTTVEPGTFQIRGEQLIIKHYLHQGHYLITLYGSNLEKIEHDTGSGKKILTSLNILPLSLSAATSPLTSLINSRTIIRPAYIQLTGLSTIIYDAINPVLATPPITIPLSLRPAAAKAPISPADSLSLLAKLQANKPAVHCDHGVGIFEGTQKRTINHRTKDYLILRYAAGDMLSVPVEYAFKVSPYFGDATPIIHRLGGRLWLKTRRRAQRDAVAFARELLHHEALRQQATRPVYHLHPATDQWLRQSFPYRLTPDQAAAWRDIRRDLTQPVPMDRLVVGDVGFGKTELAIRAACHAINNHQQVAMLAPTTILVQQHYDLFTSRLRYLLPRLATLSRFSSAADRSAVRQKIAAGEVSIVIGTHALLSPSTKWRNLGLVIIDEEQRFGVAHKEHFKTIRSRIDLLSLSATPIPRTLSMALSHLKRLSVINTAPPGRKNIVTWVGRENDTIIKQALQRELNRQGQIYVIAPKVRQLGALARRITALAPAARLAVLHGQLSSRQIALTMQQFDHRQIDILISSTIIANGLDLPHANTIIVTQATHFGLADLYQLRGRIGRRRQQGYALFLYNQTDLTPVQRQRLTALTEASRLGSGWSLARHDLAIRGAGNLLGEQQSGSVHAVGIQLFLDMVHDAIDQASPQATLTPPQRPARSAPNATSDGTWLNPWRQGSRYNLNLNLPVSSYIPTSYLPDLSQRTSLYQQLSRCRTLSHLDETFHQLTSQFGPPPPPLVNLHRLLQIQHLAAPHQIYLIDTRRITPAHQPPFYRVILFFTHLPLTASQLTRLPNGWSSQANQLILSTPAISSRTLQQIIVLLRQFRRHRKITGPNYVLAGPRYGWFD